LIISSPSYILPRNFPIGSLIRLDSYSDCLILLNSIFIFANLLLMLIFNQNISLDLTVIDHFLNLINPKSFSMIQFRFFKLKSNFLTLYFPPLSYCWTSYVSIFQIIMILMFIILLFCLTIVRYIESLILKTIFKYVDAFH
jgi:hypothetical protein